MKKIGYFITVMVGVFAITYVILYAVGLVPSNLKPDLIVNDSDLPQNELALPETLTRPDRIIIEKVGIDAQVLQPSSVNISALDEALKNGAVYYPGSGTIELGNIFIFGHSTNWPVVQNQAYKTFNGLEKLQRGDNITLEADGQEFQYIVRDVSLFDADDVLVEFDNGGQTLTLSTCNTFGQKQERWVVTAEKI